MLYLVKTKSYRAYVVAKDTDEAYNKFREYLDKKDYGWRWERDLASIEVVASESDSPKTAMGMSYDDEKKNDLLIL